MKKFKISAMLIFAAMLMFSACGDGGGGGSDDPDNPGDPSNDSVLTYTLSGGTEFKMIITPDIATSNTFPTGLDDSGSANVPARFIMGETEVTYQLWKEVYEWATTDVGGSKRADGGVLYSFANPGREGNDGTDGAVPTTAKQEPVTYINWRDTIVWCNALTEYYNVNNGSAEDLKCVYYTDASYTIPLHTSTDSNTITDTSAGSQDKPYIYASSTGNTDMTNCTAKGFRMPSCIEWEYAARFRGSDSVNAIAGSDGTYYTKGNSASGATADYNNVSATSAVAVYGVSSTAVVKSKGAAGANALGIYDMSGNVWEWCYDLHQFSSRVHSGGNYYNNANLMQVGRLYDIYPYVEDGDVGFRLSRNL